MLELDKHGRIADESGKVLWNITVFNEGIEDDPIMMYAFREPEKYPDHEFVRSLMERQYDEWLDWLDNGGYTAETVFVDTEEE